MAEENLQAALEKNVFLSVILTLMRATGVSLVPDTLPRGCFQGRGWLLTFEEIGQAWAEAAPHAPPQQTP